MIDLVLNLTNKTAHLRVDGRTFEECNIDQMQLKQLIPNLLSIRAAAEHAQLNNWTLCERCFYDNDRLPKQLI